MDTLADFWGWLPQFTKGDLPSWVAVGIALMAMFFALRKSYPYTELSNPRLQFDTDGGPISLELELTTYSHASRLSASAKVSIDNTKYPMTTAPVAAPMNYQFATVNTFKLLFTGQYAKRPGVPKTALIEVKARLSDGAKATLRERFSFTGDEGPAAQ